MNLRAIWAWVAITLTFVASAYAAEPNGFNLESSVATIRSRIVVNPAEGLALAETLRGRILAHPDLPNREVAIATADWLRAEALIRVNRANDALKVATSALVRAERAASNTKLSGDLTLARGGAAAATGNIQGALADYQRAFHIYQSAGEQRGAAMALQDIGSIYNDAGDYENALKYQQQAADAYLDDAAMSLSAYNTRGNALIELGRAREAAGEYRRALTAARALGSPLLETRILQNLARSQADSRDYVGAETTLRQAYGIAASGPASSWRPALDGVAALVALRRHQLDRAAALIDRTFATVGTAGVSMPLRDFHRTAYEIFRARGENAKALGHLEAFKSLDDEKRALAASTGAALMSARFDFANQNVKIAQRDAKIQAASARLRSTIMIGLLVAAAVVSTLLLIGFFSIRRSRNEVRAANATLSGANAALEKALAAKTEFLATTSHEIRTPLNGILGMTQVLLADRALPAGTRSRIELVHGAGETMKALVDDILDVAKIETGELVIHTDEVDLQRLLGDAAQVWAAQAETKRITLAVDLAAAPAAIMADEVRLRQVVFNLMSNALKFTDHGEVRLTASAVPDGASAGGGERLVIRIDDSGIGVPADQLDAIFESFRQVDGGTTRRHGGTGLGLSICRSLARAMGGDVTVTSILGAGSSFTLALPLVRAALPEPAPLRREITNLADADLLLIEANPLSQGILRALLGNAVRSLHIVGDGDAALAALAHGGIDHVVADGGALGLDPGQVERIAHALHGARLTMLWPSPDEAMLAALASAGAPDVLAKPLAAPALLAGLQSAYCDAPASHDIAA